MELKPEKEVTVARLSGGLFAVAEHVCRSWSEAVAEIALSLGVERKPRKPQAGTGRPPQKGGAA